MIASFLPILSQAQSLQEKYQAFFSNYYLSDTPLSGAGKIIASSKKQELISTGDTIYVSPIKDNPMYYVFAHVQSIPYSQEQKEQYDYLFKRLGSVKLSATYQKTLIMQVTNITQEISVGDHLMPSDVINTKLPDEELFTDKNISAVVTPMKGGSDFAGSYQSVLLNAGHSMGLQMGMRLYFESPSHKIDGYAIPGRYLGQGFIYRLSSHHAIALVTDAKQEILIGSVALTQRPKHHVH